MAENPIKVLLVDQDENIYTMIRSWMGDVDGVSFELQWVSNYHDALNTILQRDHDVYLFDQMLNDNQNGLELLREAIEQGFKSPIIVLTERGARIIDIEAMKLGVTEYIDKSEVSPSVLERSIRFAIERARSTQDVAYAATHDLLTGLYNRHYLLERLAAEVHSCQRYYYPLSFCLANLDGLGKVNELHSHHTGDDILCTLAKIIIRNLRPEDLAGRYGGDEICIVFPHTTAQQARMAIERVRSALSNAQFSAEDGVPVQITASFGIAEFCERAANEQQIFDCADQALRQAKASGRNRIILFNPNADRV